MDAEFKIGVVRANEINFQFLEAGEGPLVLCMASLITPTPFPICCPLLAFQGFVW